MSRFSGKQFKGATRILNEVKREEAEKRQADYEKRNAAALKELSDHGLDAETTLTMLKEAGVVVTEYQDETEVQAVTKKVRKRTKSVG